MARKPTTAEGATIRDMRRRTRRLRREVYKFVERVNASLDAILTALDDVECESPPEPALRIRFEDHAKDDRKQAAD